MMSNRVNHPRQGGYPIPWLAAGYCGPTPQCFTNMMGGQRTVTWRRRKQGNNVTVRKCGWQQMVPIMVIWEWMIMSIVITSMGAGSEAVKGENRLNKTYRGAYERMADLHDSGTGPDHEIN